MILDIEVNEGYRVGYGREDKHRGIDMDVSETDGPEECRALGGKRQGLHSMYCNDYSRTKAYVRRVRFCYVVDGSSLDRKETALSKTLRKW